MNPRKAKIFDQIFNASWYDNFGSAAGQLSRRANYSSQGVYVEVIHVRVCQQDQIDWRQIFYFYSRLSLAPQ